MIPCLLIFVANAIGQNGTGWKNPEDFRTYFDHYNNVEVVDVEAIPKAN